MFGANTRSSPQTIGHEATGVIHAPGPGVTGYAVGQRVLVGAITPGGQCEPCLSGPHFAGYDRRSVAGWQGNTIDGVQAGYARIPFARANLAVIPHKLSDGDVQLSDIASTGFSAAESGRVRLGDPVAVFAQGPIGSTRLSARNSWALRKSSPWIRTAGPSAYR